MPTKAKKTVRKSKQGFEFKPWHAFIIIALVVITGYIVVRFSHAASNTDPQAKANVQRDFDACNATPTLQVGSGGPCVTYLRRFFKDVVNDTLPEQGDFDVDLQQRVVDFQGAVNVAFIVATAGYPVPRSISDDQLNALAQRGLINSSDAAKNGHAITQDGIVGPQSWGWINTITYVYLVGN